MSMAKAAWLGPVHFTLGRDEDAMGSTVPLASKVIALRALTL